MSFVPVIVFFVFCILLFIVFLSYDLHALAMGGFIGLLIGALFAKDYEKFWDGAISGITNKNSITIVVILLIVGMFSQMMKDSNASNGFIWIAKELGVSGGIFVAFTFVACCIISTATGSSIGTMFAAFPIFFEAGIAMGSDPIFLAGAITSGCIFGDNLAPISDTTIASASTQQYKDRKTEADIAGVVASRFRYSIVAGIIALIIFAVLGGSGAEVASNINDLGDPLALVMLVPVVALLGVAIKTRSIFKAITTGLIVGIVTGLLSGIFTWSSLFSSSGELGNNVTGFLPDGLESMLGVVSLVIAVFGIMGVLNAAGAIDRLVEAIFKSKLAQTTRGAEIAMAIGASLTCSLFGGVTSAAILTFGPVVDEIGSRKGIHPYRRANILDGIVHTLPVMVPFLSAFVFITVALTGLSPIDVSKGLVYPLILFLTFAFAILTGWGLRYEGENGEQLKVKPTN